MRSDCTCDREKLCRSAVEPENNHRCGDGLQLRHDNKKEGLNGPQPSIAESRPEPEEGLDKIGIKEYALRQLVCEHYEDNVQYTRFYHIHNDRIQRDKDAQRREHHYAQHKAQISRLSAVLRRARDSQCVYNDHQHHNAHGAH